MKVLWLCNKEPAVITKSRNARVNPMGGWLDGYINNILDDKSFDLVCIYPGKIMSGEFKNVHYYSIPVIKMKKALINILKQENPDIIHIFGTEYKHTYVMTEICKKENYIDRTIISIQGLVSVCARHYTAFLPNRIVNKKSFRDIVKRDNISNGQRMFYKTGKFEIASIKNVNHIIGRTEWDKVCSHLINKRCIYYYLNESLRSSFYKIKWNIKNCEPNSIFISSCSYPIKGFHIFLEAISYIKEKFNIRVYVAGKNIICIPWYKRTAYQNYLIELISAYGLNGNIDFLGELQEEEVAFYMRKSNIFVLPSVIENSPNSLGEAMLLGCPCIASDVGGIKSMMNDGKEGFLYPADEPYMLMYHIEKLFNDPRLASEIGKAAIKRAEITHNREKNYNGLLDIYNTVEGIRKKSILDKKVTYSI